MTQTPSVQRNASPEAESARRRATLQRVLADDELFFKHFLKIRTKTGALEPFIMNRAQKYTHEKLEEQIKKQGYVRALVLKARQLGLSTYVAGRYFKRTITRKGAATFILSHQAKTTGPLFEMVRRFFFNMPDPVRPDVDTANKNQLKFKELQSEYTVGTAGSEDVGRGMTINFLHGSEVAFYARTDELETGLFQAVADLPGTEIILESTANGMNNMFYRMCMAALANIGPYILIFIPWYWDDQYRLKVPDGFEPTIEEDELMSTYGLDLEQIYWRRQKIDSLGSEWKFKQEYPMDPREAFLVSGDPFYSKSSIANARKFKASSPEAPVIMGLDCARKNDRSVFVIRQGRSILHYEVHKDLRAEGREPTQQLVAIADGLIAKYNVDKLFIDMGAGYGVVDGLKTLGYKEEVMGISFAMASTDPRALNKRAEMHLKARDWLDEGEVDIPDTDEFAFDLLIVPQENKTPTGKIYLPKKSEIKEKHGVSTDINDAFILTFAFPVRSKSSRNLARSKGVRKAGQELTTNARIRKAGQKGNGRSVRVQVDM